MKATKDTQQNILLKRARKLHNWSQQDVAERIGMPDWRTVSRWERGITRPTSHYRRLLCDLFNRNAHELGFFDPPLVQPLPTTNVQIRPVRFTKKPSEFRASTNLFV